MVLPTHPSRQWTADRMSESRPPVPDPMNHHRYPMDIHTMLQQHCNISLSHFIMAGITKQGDLITFSGPREAGNPMVYKKYIDLDGYLAWYNNSSMLPTPSPSSYDEGYFGHGDADRHPVNPAYGSRRQYDRRRMPYAYEYEEESGFRNRKRQRAAVAKRDTTLDAGPSVSVVGPPKKRLKVGNKEEVWKFYEQRFKNIQQSACKMIAKAWIKLIAPKKQSNHPYTGSDAKAPDWWPKPTGPTRDDRVRHKEPDHLYKPERVWLLNHILSMVVEPNRTQHRDIQKLNINVTKLEEATFEALSSFFGDVENPNNAKKKPYLKEIFRVARYEERVRNGEIDADVEVLVSADDKIPEDWQEEEEDTPQDEDDAHQPPITSSPKPEHVLPAVSTDGTLQSGSSFNMGNLPVRGHPYSQSIMQPDLSAGSSTFVESSSIGVNNQPSISQSHTIPLLESYSDPHASSRRASLYTAAPEYASAPGSNLYSAWPQSSQPTTSPVYSFNQPQQHPHSAGPFVEQASVSLTQTPQYLEAPPYDAMHNNAYRPTSLTQGPVNPQTTHSFPTYLTASSSGLKMDPLRSGHPQEDDDHKRWS